MTMEITRRGCSLDTGTWGVPSSEELLSAPLPSPFALPLGFHTWLSNVLVVDDSQLNRAVCARILKSLGLTSAEACDGDEALNRLLGGGARDFECILMDMQMPRLDGPSCARALREHGIDLPIVAITTSSAPADVELCLSSGMDAYLHKPFTREGLARTLQSAAVAKKRRGTQPAAAAAAAAAAAVAAPLTPPGAGAAATPPGAECVAVGLRDAEGRVVSLGPLVSLSGLPPPRVRHSVDLGPFPPRHVPSASL